MQPAGHFAEQFSAFAVDVARLCAWLVLLAAVFVPLEHFWAGHPRRGGRRSVLSDLIYYFLSGFVPKLLLAVPVAFAAAAFHLLVPGGWYARAALLPVWFRLLAGLVVGDAGAYWGHRWSHEIPLLWRFHSLHHSAEDIDWLVNTRAHPLDMFFTRFCGLVPMYAIGLAQPMGNRFDTVPVIAALIGTMWGFFIHANLSWRFGPLERIVASPAFHHWHHTNDGPEALDKNYAALLPCMDLIFGTFHLPPDRLPGKYGTDTPVPARVAEQLLGPLLP